MSRARVLEQPLLSILACRLIIIRVLAVADAVLAATMTS